MNCDYGDIHDFSTCIEDYSASMTREIESVIPAEINFIELPLEGSACCVSEAESVVVCCPGQSLLCAVPFIHPPDNKQRSKGHEGLIARSKGDYPRTGLWITVDTQRCTNARGSRLHA